MWEEQKEKEKVPNQMDRQFSKEGSGAHLAVASPSFPGHASYISQVPIPSRLQPADGHLDRSSIIQPPLSFRHDFLVCLSDHLFRFELTPLLSIALGKHAQSWAGWLVSVMPASGCLRQED